MIACPLCGRTMERSHEMPPSRVAVTCAADHAPVTVAVERLALAGPLSAKNLAHEAGPSPTPPETEEGIPDVDELEAEHAQPSRYYADAEHLATHYVGCYACGHVWGTPDPSVVGAPRRCEHCQGSDLTPTHADPDHVDDAVASVVEQRNAEGRPDLPAAAGGRGKSEREINRALAGS